MIDSDIDSDHEIGGVYYELPGDHDFPPIGPFVTDFDDFSSSDDKCKCCTARPVEECMDYCTVDLLNFFVPILEKASGWRRRLIQSVAYVLFVSTSVVISLPSIAFFGLVVFLFR